MVVGTAVIVGIILIIKNRRAASQERGHIDIDSYEPVDAPQTREANEDDDGLLAF